MSEHAIDLTAANVVLLPLTPYEVRMICCMTTNPFRAALAAARSIVIGSDLNDQVGYLVVQIARQAGEPPP